MTTKTLLGFAVALAAAMPLWAASITVENFSFELPGTGKVRAWNGENGVDIPGWASDTTAADSGVESDWPGSSEGSWAGFLMGTDPAAWQLTGHTIAAGDTFTLLVDAHNNWSATTPAHLTMSLYYDDAGSRVTAGSSTVELTDSFAQYSLAFDSGTLPGSIGKNIGIMLQNGATTSDSWIGIDNVRLDVAAIPEPGTVVLLLGGLAALGAVRRRR
ncbi:MAG TPA: PEP-CTERM sorting domain-containing protein [Verrucomicrobiota bacterium]|nr:PEP-CTERM sorting domain-containing protein [Verrucomicrobiota bacterium]HNU51339.1 PEP-CTERM sorting domain-containing protein [Verrucomicrobiota bacterium]